MKHGEKIASMPLWWAYKYEPIFIIAAAFTLLSLFHWTPSVNMLLLFIAICAGVAFLHEGSHYALVWKYGGKPKCGIGKQGLEKFNPYVTSDTRFSRDRTVKISLAPIFVITGLGILLVALIPSLLLIWCLAVSLNFAFAANDVWGSYILLRDYPPTVYVKGEKSELIVFYTLKD